MSNSSNEAEYENAVIKISGMSCQHCAQLIEKNLNSESGVAEAKVNLVAEQAVVKYQPMEVDLTKLKKIIRDSGYEVVESR